MPYRRYERCPLLTTHGHILALLHGLGGLRQRDIAEAMTLSETHVGRLMRELSGEGLISSEKLGNSVWWGITAGLDLAERLFSDRQRGGSLLL